MDRLRVLVVDDQPDIAELLDVLLEQLGHDCRVACTGTEAIEVALEFEPHVILLDIGLPDMTGYEVARALRARPRGSNVYIAAVTGWGREQDIKQALEAGFDNHMTKPASRERLSNVVAEARTRRDRARSASDAP